MADDADVTKIKSLIGTGVKSIFSENDRVELQSISDLISASEYLQAQAQPRKRFRGGSIRMSCSI